MHRGFLVLAYGLRRLQGQVVSLAEAKSLKIEPGSPVVDKSKLRGVRVDVAEGLSRMEGSLPPNHINPLAHRVVHYPSQTATFSRIWAFSMWTFERFNKRIKSMVKKNASANESIATNALLEIATRFVDMSNDDIENDLVELRERRTSCFLQRLRKWPRR